MRNDGSAAGKMQLFEGRQYAAGNVTLPDGYHKRSVSLEGNELGCDGGVIIIVERIKGEVFEENAQSRPQNLRVSMCILGVKAVCRRDGSVEDAAHNGC